jgi:hypothetical protein
MTKTKINRTKLRKILLVENITILCLSGLFAKLVIFNHYRYMNLPLKFLFTFMYFASVEPMTIFTGYYANKFFDN